MEYNLYEILEKNKNDKSFFCEGSDIISFKSLYELVDAHHKTIFNQIEYDGIISVFANKSIHIIACFFALLKNKTPYSYINKELPAIKIKGIIDSLKSNYIIVDDVTINVIRELYVIQDEFDLSNSSGLKVIRLNNNSSLTIPPETAYLLSTSGTTGTPKIIPITHKNAAVFICWMSEQFLTSEDRVLSIAEWNFDLSVFDIFSSLHAKASLILPEVTSLRSVYYIQTIIERNITVIYTTPSFIRILSRLRLRQPADCVKRVLLAGEKLFKPDIDKAKTVFPMATFYNLYGPSETNVCTYYAVPEHVNQLAGESLPIGVECPYNKVLLLDNDGGISHEGEIIVCGDNVFEGYGNIESDSFVDINNEVFYRTGDYGKIENNNLVFIHRKDRQIKNSGFRVELDEIESSILNLKYINDAAVIYFEDKIIAFYNSVEDNVSTIMLKQDCLKVLPSYAVPHIFIRLYESLPLTITSKVDYESLKGAYVEKYLF